jgi:class 3 adenylate cyclase/tetratricopeptide (TPR) repeat protein
VEGLGLELEMESRMNPPKGAAAALFRSYIPEHLLPRFSRGDFPPPGRPETIWAVTLFSDVSGFTPLSESLTRLGKEGSERLNLVLYGHFTRMVEIIQAHGGSVIKYGGDAATVLFVAGGADDRREVVLRSLRCSAAMQRAILEYSEVPVPELQWTFSVKMKIGLACGELRQLLLGNENRQEYVAAGRPLDRMSESEHHATVGQVVAAPELVELAPADLFSPLADGFSLLTGDPGTNPDRLRSEPPEVPTEVARRFLHPTISEQLLRTGGTSLLGEHRKCSAMFVLFQGLDYDDDPLAYEKLQQYYLLVHGILNRYGGHLNQVAIGDKGSVLLVFFGAPASHEDDELRAVLAAMEIRDRRPEFISGQKIGVNTGSVFAGNLGSDLRREYTALGDAINLAARLMGAAAVDQVLCSGSTWSKTREAIELVPLPPIKVKGKSAPVAIYDPRRPRKQGGSELRPLSPLHGRDVELEVVSETLETVAAGQGQWLHVDGKPGLGKTRFVDEIVARARGRFELLRGRGVPYASESAWVPWAELLTGRLDLAADSAVDERRKALARLAAERPGAATEDVERIGAALGWWTRDENETLEDSVLQQRILAAFEKLLIDRGRGTLLVLDDLQWVDEASRGLLAHLGRGVEGAPILIVSSGRPDSTAPGWADIAGFRRLELTELPDGAVEATVRGELAGNGVDDDVLRLVTERARGNPLYVHEIVGHLRSTKAILMDAESGRHYLNPHFAADLLPENVNDLLLARMDGLPETTRQILRVASVFGSDFERELLAGVLPMSLGTGELVAELDRLVDLGLIAVQDRPAGRFRFEQVLTQEVAYESLSYAERRRIHREIAARLEERFGDAASQHASLLAHHFDLAREVKEAFSYRRLAADRAISSHSNPEARHHLDRAIALVSEAKLEERERQLLELLSLRAGVLDRLGLVADGFADQKRRFGVAHSLGDVRVESDACYWMGFHAEAQGQLRRAFALARSARRFAEVAGWTVGVAQATNLMAIVHTRLGETPLGLELWEDLFREHDLGLFDGALRGQILLNHANALLQAGRLGDALKGFEATLDLARGASDRGLELKALIALGVVHKERKELGLLEATLLEADRRCREIGDLRRSVDVLLNRGTLAVTRQDLDQAETLFRETGYLSRRLGLEAMRADAALNLGAVSWWRSDFAGAETFYREAWGIYERMGSGNALVARANVVELLLARDDERAEGELEALGRLAREASALAVAVWAHTEMGKLKDRRGQEDEALAEWREAVRLGSEPGGEETAADARALLASKSPPSA